MRKRLAWVGLVALVWGLLGGLVPAGHCGCTGCDSGSHSSACCCCAAQAPAEQVFGAELAPSDSCCALPDAPADLALVGASETPPPILLASTSRCACGASWADSTCCVADAQAAPATLVAMRPALPTLCGAFHAIPHIMLARPTSGELGPRAPPIYA